jgi:tripartite-type tricarboxylate transporter receptor subunit TctC
MSRSRLSLLVAGALLFGITLVKASDDAAKYPAMNVELIIPFPAGGTTDVIARLVAQTVSEKWGRPVIVTNKAGATGAIASEYVARAKPDGYTLLVATASTHAVLPAYRSDLRYDTVTSFTPATLLATFPNMLVVNPNIPANTVQELIDLLKKNPGKLNFASSGVGGSGHFGGELFKLMTKTDMRHVPYRGSAPALNDLIAGNVELTIDNMSTVWPQVKQGTLRALGVASLTRTPLAPDVPAIAETVPGFEVTSWIGVVAPAGTPAAIVEKISKDFAEAVSQPKIVKQLEEFGATSVTDSPAEFAAFIRADREKWKKVAAASTYNRGIARRSSTEDRKRDKAPERKQSEQG